MTNEEVFNTIKDMFNSPTYSGQMRAGKKLKNNNVEICNSVSFSDTNGESVLVASSVASIEFYDEKAVYTYGGVSREIPENSNLSIELPFE